ncbi:MAG: hypothetical protein IPP17_14320 [Bacteroidetes bacterium]|nr:hypothetical protein [Bacteroidota bacterium]
MSTCSCSGTGCVSGAGGGGGYYGGGSSLASSGGGGGSSYAGAGTSAITHTQGTRTGNGQVILSWNATSSNCTSLPERLSPYRRSIRQLRMQVPINRFAGQQHPSQVIRLQRVLEHGAWSPGLERLRA